MNKFEQIGVNLQYDAINKVCGLTVSTVPFTAHIS